MSTMLSHKAGRRARRRFTEEFKAGSVRLGLDEHRTVGAVARGPDLAPSALSPWATRAQAEWTKGRSGPMQQGGGS
jgi:transposase-like protein